VIVIAAIWLAANSLGLDIAGIVQRQTSHCTGLG
jgi:hypothetical protein